ncbi:MAG: AAA family ATPase, partial [Microcoleaceae cyanobacterium]
LSGSGKSTIARYLARKINAIHIRSDAVRKHIAGIDLYEKGSADIYTPEMTQKTYQRLAELGMMLAQKGFSVILDAKYDRLSLRENAINLARSHQLEVQIISCNAPLEVLRERLEKRVGDITDANVDLLASQIESAEPFSELEKEFVHEIDTTLGLEVQLQQL